VGGLAQVAITSHYSPHQHHVTAFSGVSESSNFDISQSLIGISIDYLAAGRSDFVARD
jgi:hypothetical protein